MTQGSPPLTQKIAALVDQIALQSIGIDRLTENVYQLASSHNQLIQTVDNLGVKIDRLGDRIDNLARVADAQQITARQQSENIAALIQHSTATLNMRVG